MKEPEIDKKVDEGEVPPPRGRDLLLSALRVHRGDDYAPADDDSFLDDIHARYRDVEDELSGYRSSTDTLREAITRDPRVGAFFSAVAAKEGGESFPGAFARIFGRDAFDGDPDFEKGYQDRLESERASLDRARKSHAAYDASLSRFSSDRGMSDAERAALNDDVIGLLTGVLDGSLPDDLVDLVYKGRHYDRDVEAAARGGAAEGRNERIRSQLKGMKGELPDLGRSTTSGSPGDQLPPSRRRRSEDIFDEFKKADINF